MYVSAPLPTAHAVFQHALLQQLLTLLCCGMTFTKAEQLPVEHASEQGAYKLVAGMCHAP